MRRIENELKDFIKNPILNGKMNKVDGDPL